MYRSNPLGFASSALFLLGVALVWYWAHQFSFASKIWLTQGYCAFASATGFWMWQHGQRRARIVDDIPTSKIASAPQGYVELLGRAAPLPDQSLVSGPSGVPCLWFRCEVAQRDSNDSYAGASYYRSRDLVTSLLSSAIYLPHRTETSDASFIIHDGSDEAIIFPYGAEVICAHKQIWYEGDTRFIEERILPGDALYVLGEFSTYHAGQVGVDLLNEVSAQISIWQADKPALLRRFDRNGNRVLDADEWEAMHAEALRLAQEKEKVVMATPAVNRIMQPDRGFQYLISSRDPATLAGHFRWWRSAGLALFLAAGTVGIWLTGNSLLG